MWVTVSFNVRFKPHRGLVCSELSSGSQAGWEVISLYGKISPMYQQDALPTWCYCYYRKLTMYFIMSNANVNLMHTFLQHCYFKGKLGSRKIFHRMKVHTIKYLRFDNRCLWMSSWGSLWKATCPLPFFYVLLQPTARQWTIIQRVKRSDLGHCVV